ncbi:MAG TPA: hypothetical protein DCR14_15325, partial [Acidimicrobiaceae bacterium]|nr:hypothetical protein [Acidimicrobiaceae bacterium]
MTMPLRSTSEPSRASPNAVEPCTVSKIRVGSPPRATGAAYETGSQQARGESGIMGGMRFGLFGINNGALADPDSSVRAAQAAEAAGFDSVWTGEHVVLPDPQAPPSPAPPHLPMLDPAVALAYIAAHTSSIALATGIIILPQRNPLVLAKEMASVDVVSKGRLWFGYAAGYLHQEFAALGIPFDDRGARCDEYLDAMLELWGSESPTFAGETVRFSGIDAHPRPVQRPHPRLIVG